MGDAIPEGAARSSSGSTTCSRSVRRNRSIANDPGPGHQRGASSATGGERTALNFIATASDIVLFAILWFVRTRARQPNGVLTGLFFICYAVFRIVVENFREPDAELIGPFTRGQFFSFFLVAIGAAFIVAAKRRPTFPRRMSGK